MDKRGLYLVIFILAISLVSGAEQELYKAFFSPTTVTDIGGINYTAQSYGVPPSKAVVKYGGNTEIVELEDCKERVGVRICFLSYKEGDYDQEAQRQTYEVELSVSQDVGEITVKRTKDKDSLEVGDETTITSTISNSGDMDIADIQYLDDFPAEIELLSVTGGCVKEFNKVTWKGSLDAGQDYKCSYTIKIKNTLDYKSKASVSYHNGLVDTETKSNTISFDIENKFFTTDLAVSKEGVDLNEEFVLWINTTNIKDKALKIQKLKIELPEHVSIVRRDGVLDDNLEWDGIVSFNKSRNLRLELKGASSGNEKVNVGIDLLFNGVVLHFDSAMGLIVKKPELKVVSEFDGFQYGSGEEVEFWWNLSNLNKIGLRNISLEISSNFDGIKDKKLDNLEVNANSSEEIFREKITLPEVKKTFDIEVNFKYNYETYSGEKLSDEYTEYLFIVPGEVKREKKEAATVQTTKDETPVQQQKKKEVEEDDEIAVLGGGGSEEEPISVILYVVIGVLIVMCISFFFMLMKAKKNI